MKDCVLDVIFFQNGKLIEYYYMYIQSMSLNIFFNADIHVSFI